MRADSALILAGGKSTRMGYDKKHLALGGATILESLITCLQSLFTEVLVSSNEPAQGIRVLPDELGSGPLAGIYQGLRHCQSDYLYVVACDMPFISAEYIRYIRDIVCSQEVDACIARRSDGFYEPFNSFFSKTCIEPIHEALLRREYKIRMLLDKLNLHIVEPAMINQYYPGDMFFNINYQADLERAKTLLLGQGSQVR